MLSLAIAELAGIVASVAVVVLLTRRSIRPLADALALQRRSVADASHELRAPLTVLHTRIQLLGRRFDDGDAQQTKEQIDALASDTRVLGEVIEDLLASASMTSDNAPQDRVDLVVVVQAVCESMAQHAQSAGVTLVVEPTVFCPKVISWYSGRGRASPGAYILDRQRACTRASRRDDCGRAQTAPRRRRDRCT